jgi:hypothetical protein
MSMGEDAQTSSLGDEAVVDGNVCGGKNGWKEKFRL